MKEKAAEKAKKGKKIDVRCIIAMDDCLADKKLWINDTRRPDTNTAGHKKDS